MCTDLEANLQDPVFYNRNMKNKRTKLNDKYDVIASEFGWTLVRKSDGFGLYYEDYKQMMSDVERWSK